MQVPPTQKELRRFRQHLLCWQKNNKRSFPWRQTRDPWKLLVAEVLLRQTGAEKVDPVYKVFIKRWPSPQSLSRAREQTVRKLIHPLGLQYRASELIGIAKDILSQFGGQVPTSKEQLLSMKGVGEYTASALLAHAFGKKELAIDTNVLRLLKRIYGLDSPTIDLYGKADVKRLAVKLLPSRSPGSFNYALLDFCAKLCKFYNPKCPDCPLLSLCELHPNL